MVFVKEFLKNPHIFSLVIVRRNMILIILEGGVGRCGNLVVSALDSRSIMLVV